MDIKEESLFGGRQNDHWYYRTKLAALRLATQAYAPASILDVGSGSGFFAREMLRSGGPLKATCVDPGYAGDREETVNGLQLAFRRTVSTSEADLVLMMDVLEHVQDDVALVAEYAEKVASGTRFFITVPAFQWLWSGHDVFLEHYRRYTLRQLENVLTQGGLHVERTSYLYGLLFPIAATMRLASKLQGVKFKPRSQMRSCSPVLNSILFQACRLELPFFLGNRGAGLTATACAFKR